ncbi:MAG: DUF4902 domain-containing protein [Pseudomonadota bacterium]
MYTVSADGAIRLSLAELRMAPWVHLESGLDGQMHAGGQAATAASQAAITGFTEWVSEGDAPRLSMGWDWEVVHVRGETLIRRIGLPYSNLRVVDAERRELDFEKSLALQADCIDALCWQEVVRREIGLR